MNSIFQTFKIKNNKTIYFDLYIFLKQEIELNNLVDKLPPMRKLASILNISINTVSRAYSELENIKYVKRKEGSGVFITYTPPEKVNSSIEAFVEKEDFFNFSFNEKFFIDFINSSPNISFLPVKDIKKAINYILDKDKELALISEGYLGSSDLKEAIKNYLVNFKIETTSEKIQILSGAQQGIDLVAKTLILPKSTIVTEELTYLGALSSFKNLGAKIKKIPITNEGINIEKLENFLKENKINFLYTMSNFHTPTGITMSLKTKKNLLNLAEKYNFYIVEDDSSSDLYYKSIPPISLKSLDKNDRVVYIKSFSKIFMPGFRLGFCIVPDSILSNFLNLKRYENLNSSTLYQKSFAYLLNSGSIEKHIRKSQKNFKKIQESIIKCLNTIEGVSFYIPDGGLSLWIKLPNNISSRGVYTLLLKKNIGIVPGYIYSKNHDNYIKLNFARIEEKDIQTSIKELKIVIQTLQYFNI